MAREYSNPKREHDPHTLPDIEVFQMTAQEVVESGVYDDDLWEMRDRFPLMGMNSRDRQRAIDTLVAEQGIKGGWFWQSCQPGCLPDSDPMGPFDSYAEALADAREGVDDDDDEEA